MKKQTRRDRSQRGFAIIFALLAMLVLGVLAATVMCTSQGQTWTAHNYRMTTQARYAAEAGVQVTMDWLSNSYTNPTNFASYDMTKNPVQYNGKAVVLSAVAGTPSNYPDAAVINSYSTALNQALNTLPNASYATYATLLRMNPAGGVPWLGTNGGGVIQTWKITSVGNVGGVRHASVQVEETFERTGTPIFNYPIEATGTDCGSITFSQNGSLTDSYNSSVGPYGGANVQTTGGNLATNGNVKLGSGVTVEGTLYVPNTNVGACPDGITSSGTYKGASKLTSSLNPPLPWGCTAQPCYPPGPVSTANQNISDASCLSISGCKSDGATTLTDGGRSTSANVFTLAPGTYGNVTINGADVIHVSAGTYNINSINFAQDGQFVVDSGPVVFNIVGNCASGCPTESLPSPMSSTEVIYGAGNAGFNGCSGGVTANPDVYGKATCGSSKTPFSGIPSNLQIVYGGTYTMRLGGMPNAIVLYAPQAGYYTPGAPVGLFGSAVVKDFRDDSGSPFHYDSALQNSAMQVGQYRPIGGFTWSKF